MGYSPRGCKELDTTERLTELTDPRVVISGGLNPGFPGGAFGKEPTCQCRRHRRGQFDPLDREDPLEEGMATHSSILAWRISWTEEPGGLQSMGSQSQTRLSA